jgi:hypothetical protein
MAVHKATRSNPLAQPQPQHTRRSPNPDTHHKAELFDNLRQLNRGFGIAVAALHRLGGRTNNTHLGGTKNARLYKPGIFPHRCLADYRNRTEALRAQANRDLLRLFASREEQDAERFESLSPNSQLKRSQQ